MTKLLHLALAGSLVLAGPALAQDKVTLSCAWAVVGAAVVNVVAVISRAR